MPLLQADYDETRIKVQHPFLTKDWYGPEEIDVFQESVILSSVNVDPQSGKVTANGRVQGVIEIEGHRFKFEDWVALEEDKDR